VFLVTTLMLLTWHDLFLSWLLIVEIS
jgi:hypothetical protein